MTNKDDKLFILPLTNKNYKKLDVFPHIQSSQVGVSSFSRINISFEHDSVTFLYLEYAAWTLPSIFLLFIRQKIYYINDNIQFWIKEVGYYDTLYIYDLYYNRIDISSLENGSATSSPPSKIWVAILFCYNVVTRHVRYINIPDCLHDNVFHIMDWAYQKMYSTTISKV